MSDLSNILKFYRDAYAFDYRSTNVRNFFGSEAQNIYLIEDLSPLSQANLKLKVESRWGAKITKELSIHQKEKGLYAGALFLFGQSKMLGRKIPVAPPLYLYDVELSEHFGNYRIELDLDFPIINPFFLEYLKSKYSEITITYDEFASGLPSGPLGVAEIIKIETKLTECFPFLNVEGLQKWYVPHAKIENARFAYKERSDIPENQLICGVCVGMIKKQEGSRGVINELTELANRNLKKNTLQQLFSNHQSHTSFESKQIEIPIRLSDRQKQVFYNLYKFDLTMVIGPPGTGKSYTIAAMVADLIGKGKSVLVASKNSQAGKVVSNKLEDEIGLKGLVIKASRRSYKHHLKNKLENILSGMHSSSSVSRQDVQNLQIDLLKLQSDIQMLQERVKEREREEQAWASFFDQYREGFFQKLKKKWIEYKHQNATKIWDMVSRIEDLKLKKSRLIRKYIKAAYEYRLQSTLRSHRKDLALFARSLSAKSGASLEKFFEGTNFSNILKAIPGWIINTGDAHHILPLEPEIFDVLIIDEATQCDISSCLPLIYRAKKVVIIGDPKQLRHLSFLSNAMEAKLNKTYHLEGMRFRDYSILDLFRDRIADQSQISFLNEHFRSFPDIISFSNYRFYNQKLHLMTSTPITSVQKHIFVSQVHGKRNKNGENQIEAEALLQKIKEIADHEQNVEKNISSSIGVLSPFRAQVNLLKSMIKDTFELSVIQKHQILIGTPHHFQGEERDVMLLSFVIDAETPANSARYLNKTDVFNVSVTRARSLQISYTSIKTTDLDEDLLLRQYLSHIEAPRKLREANSHIAARDHFLEEISNTLRNWKVDRILPHYAICGVMIDIVVVHNHKTYCIDLIGYPGAFEAMFDDYQLNMLDRMGHKVFFLPYSEWHLNREESIESLHRYIFGKKVVSL